jgi:LemA protein
VLLVALVVLVLLAFGVFLFGAGVFNRLVALRERYKNAFGQIEVQLKRRYDLIPNLVETAKGYMAHEKQTLEAVIAARSLAVSGLGTLKNALGTGAEGAMKDFTAAEGALTGALSRLIAVSESYPELKANENMLRLSEELTATENKVAFARQAYNDSVTEFNTYKKSFPALLFAGIADCQADAQILAFADSAQIAAAPRVQF